MSSRAELLDRCQEWLTANGFGPHSLRQIAAGAGTSHRMLIYHFGSREGLLAEVVGRVEAATRQVLTELVGSGDPAEAARRFWHYLAAPELAGAERLFFEIYADALRDRVWTASFRESVIDASLGPITELFLRLGVDAQEAPTVARLAIATTRGLLLDLLLTGDREQLTRASDLFTEMVLLRRS